MKVVWGESKTKQPFYLSITKPYIWNYPNRSHFQALQTKNWGEFVFNSSCPRPMVLHYFGPLSKLRGMTFPAASIQTSLGNSSYMEHTHTHTHTNTHTHTHTHTPRQSHLSYFPLFSWPAHPHCTHLDPEVMPDIPAWHLAPVETGPSLLLLVGNRSCSILWQFQSHAVAKPGFFIAWMLVCLLVQSLRF